MQRESERGIFLFTLFKANELFDRSIYESSYEYNLDVNIPGEAGTGILVIFKFLLAFTVQLVVRC